MKSREEYLLTCLMEECAELIQRASKADRFGLDEVQKGQTQNNRARMEAEFSDVLMIAKLLELGPPLSCKHKPDRWNAALDIAVSSQKISVETAESLRLPPVEGF